MVRELLRTSMNINRKLPLHVISQKALLKLKWAWLIKVGVVSKKILEAATVHRSIPPSQNIFPRSAPNNSSSTYVAILLQQFWFIYNDYYNIICQCHAIKTRESHNKLICTATNIPSLLKLELK